MAEEFRPTKGKILTVLPFMAKEYYVSFEFLFLSLTNNRALIHFSIGGDCCSRGFRNPFVLLTSPTKLHLAAAVNGNGNHHIYHDDTYTTNKWYKLEIEQVLTGGKVTPKRLKR